MNKEKLQNYNSILNENNISLVDIENMINELPDAGGSVEPFYIDNTSYLFYNGYRLNCLEELLRCCKDVTRSGYMFYGCENLTSLDLTGFDTSNITDMGAMFYKNTSLTELNISNFNTVEVGNFSYMFNECKILTSLDLSSFDFGKAINVGNIFYKCSNLENLSFGYNLGKGYRPIPNFSNYTLDLSATKLSHDSLMNVINNLYDLNLTYNVADGGTLYTQQLIVGTDNIAKLSDEEILLATNKGWVVS